jgi:hypothetical protein
MINCKPENCDSYEATGWVRRSQKMNLDDPTHLSAEDWLALMPTLFTRRGYELGGCMLQLQGKKAQHLAYCLPTLATLSGDDLEKWFLAGDHLHATFSYVVTQGGFCSEMRASVVPWEMELVDRAALQQWLRSSGLLRSKRADP